MCIRDRGIQPDVLAFGEDILKNLESRFQEIDTVAEYNQLKVLKAMQDHKVSDIHFAATSGYGYNDMGRDTLEEVYASAFHAEAALVRPQITCGTHAPVSYTHLDVYKRQPTSRPIPGIWWRSRVPFPCCPPSNIC